MIARFWKILTSLRLTVILLGFGIVLVFVGTVAQADEGLYQAQARYFKHWLVYPLTMFGHKIPMLLPGGYLIGTLLLLNLTAAHIKRFQFSSKKIGIHLTHAGVTLLLVGQLLTDLLSRETQLRFAEGQAKVWSESGMDYELAFITDKDADHEEVVAIPQHALAASGEIKHEKLPFTVLVEKFWKNSAPAYRAPRQDNGPPLTTNGVANNYDFQTTPVTHKMDDKNVPTAVLELVAPNGSLGRWVASGWSADETMAAGMKMHYVERLGMGRPMADKMVGQLTAPQVVASGGRNYALALRPARSYKPFSLTLLKMTHTVYPGTTTPRDFRSRVQIDNPVTGEKRETEIYMNSPLRYGGLTFYQYQMSERELSQRIGEKPTSTLQVVRNPAWLTPYAGCAIVGGGLVVQFLTHLAGFISRRKKT